MRKNEDRPQAIPWAAAKAGFSLFSPGQPFSPGTEIQILVIGVATWSDPDLAALERLACTTRIRKGKIIVFDVDDWTLDLILATFPGAGRFISTPVVLQYRHAGLTFQGEGPDAILWLDQI